ncbi:MAG: DUF4274 domain-containing protein [Myxococcota bacterium]
MSAWLQDLDEADRGFLTWLSAMVRTPMDALLDIIGVEVEGDRIRELDVSPLGPLVAERPRPLAPPFAGLDGLVRLDCSGLRLPRLDLTHLPTLRHLRCADNALRELDLTATRDLETLDCTGNQLMTLDLRGLTALRAVRCGENALAMLALDADSSLVELDCSHNQLMTLELGEMPALRELRCTRNALVRLAGRAPALVSIEAGHNELTQFDLEVGDALRVLRAPHNRLGQLEPGGSLEHLDIAHNYLSALDLRDAGALASVTADHNQLVAVAWPETSRLLRIYLDGNRLASVAPPAGPTRVLTCDRNHLARLETGGLPELSKLSCAHNAITRLDVTANPRLVDLDARDNRLTTLDLTGHPWLVTATVDDAVAVTADDGALHLVPVPTEPDLGPLDGASLHRAALAAWHTGPAERLLAIAEHPRCDWGTALLLYWTHRPLRFRRHADRETLEPFEVATWTLLRAIEARATGAGFPTRACPFDPRDDRSTASVEGVDWTTDAAPDAPPVPEPLRQPSGGPPHSTLPSNITMDGHHTS